MTYVVSAECQNCDEKPCVAACAVDALYVPVDTTSEVPNQLYISPEACIDCAACAGECQHEAIYAEDDLPTDQANALELNKLCDTQRERFTLATATRTTGDSTEADYTKREYGVS